MWLSKLAKSALKRVIVFLFISLICLSALAAASRNLTVSAQDSPSSGYTDNFNQLETGFQVYNVTAPAEFPLAISADCTNADVTTWEFGDGKYVQVPWNNPTQYATKDADYLYTVPGTYNASWTVTDSNNGVISTSSWQINVFPASSTLAVAAAINPWTQPPINQRHLDGVP